MRGLGHLRTIACHPRMMARREQWLAAIAGASRLDVRGAVREIRGDRAFLDPLRHAYREHTVYRAMPMDFMVEPIGGGSMFFHLVSLYALVRLTRPATIVETGGTPGKSSAFILRAIERNGAGSLHTVDLPPPTVPAVVRASESSTTRSEGLLSNWCVPDALRARQQLLVGPAQQILPGLLRQLGSVDLFIHDSDHSYEHMTWELRTALPFVRPGGYLWADDINSNAAWGDFCEAQQLRRWEFLTQGIARKA